MTVFKKASSTLAISAISSTLFLSSAYAEEKLTINPTILKMINEIITEMQRKTMSSVYPEMPFKAQMRGKMMTERASQNYMIQVIQPQMMQKNMSAEKLKLMNQMSKF